MSSSPLVYHVSAAEFEAKVLERSKQVPVVVDFWAPWCGPCRSLTPVLEKLVADRKGAIELAKVDIDQEQELAVRFGIQSIPLVIGFRDGKPLLEFMGLISETQIQEFLDRLLPSAADLQARSAGDLESKDPAQAEKLYRQALQADPDQPKAVLGLVRLLLARPGKEGEAADLLENAPLAGDDAQEAERLGAILWLRQHADHSGDAATLAERVEVDPKNARARYDLGLVQAAEEHYPEALANLLTAAELDRKLATEKVREAMVKVFQAVGVRSELADEYRDKLAAILY